MITAEARKKAKIVVFLKKPGLDATLDAFNISKSSIYAWHQIFKNNNGKIQALNNKSRKPKNIQKRIISEDTKNFVIDNRSKFGKIGKVKLSKMLKMKK
jgi:hypothetical protein